MAPYRILKAWWSATRTVGLESKVTPEATIAALERRYDVVLPADFRDYLLYAAPAEENWDDEDGNWWPAEHIKNIPDDHSHPVSDPIARSASMHLLFLDWCCWGFAWAISCADDETHGKVALIDGRRGGYVADSFGEFVHRYTTDWRSVTAVPEARTLIDRLWSWVRGR